MDTTVENNAVSTNDGHALGGFQRFAGKRIHDQPIVGDFLVPSASENAAKRTATWSLIRMHSMAYSTGYPPSKSLRTMGNNEFLEKYERADLITAENSDGSGQTERPSKIEGNSEGPAALTDEGPRYYKSRSVEEWRAYHREYYRKNAERRREQKKASHQRMALVRAYAMYSGHMPKRVIRMLFLRKESAPSKANKSTT